MFSRHHYVSQTTPLPEASVQEGRQGLPCGGRENVPVMGRKGPGFPIQGTIERLT